MSFRRRKLRGFTLTEILIVIGIIVLLLALAVPTMRVLTGGRSVDAAENQLSAFLGRARGEAIALQRDTGVLFYKDLAGRTQLALVYEPDHPISADPNPPDLYLDLVPDRDVFSLPIGVDAQTIDNAMFTAGGSRLSETDEGFIGYNRVLITPTGPLPLTILPFGGVILFDANGQLTRKTYGFRASTPAGTDTAIFQLLYNGTPPAPPRRDGFTCYDTSPRVPSQVGLVLFDHESFLNTSPPQPTPPDSDPMFQGTGSSSMTSQEVQEEDWLDKNSVPLLINRYNGTLIRGE